MRGVALASGSNGNAVYVETDDVRLLFDAGCSGKALERRAATRGVSLAHVDAIVLSHAHGDHVSASGILHRRFGLPVYATGGTWRSASRRMGPVERPGRFRPGETIAFGATKVHTLATPHDAPESVAFVVESGGQRLGVLRDLGHAFPRLLDAFAGLDGAFLESNHDPEWLETGPYPWHLKERISRSVGHLSNKDCVALVEETANGRLQSLVLAHLSGECNSPEKALASAAGLRHVCAEIHVAPRDRASPWMELE